ncbi:MAG: cbb3-type cytochrome c oxidase subunit 3 [Stagnimonas sp.]|nr:cbb3-type cytochrome c oxidase subunit 3 [Stagnimonas sp.]
MISGIITGLLLAAFFAITYWAYSSRNSARWQQAAQLPLQDEAELPCCSGKPDAKRASGVRS